MSEPPIIPAAGVRFELFYGFGLALAPDRPAWLPAPPRAAEGLDGWAPAWIGIADTVPGLEPEAGFEEIAEALAGLDPLAFARRWLTSHLHDAGVAAALVAGSLGLRDAIAGLPARKREWLAHVGLYPMRRDAPGPALLQRLIDDPAAVQAAARQALTAYWEGGFRAFWERLAPAAEGRRRQVEDLLAEQPAEAVFERLSLRAEFDAEAGELRAVRGGYRIAFADIRAIYVLPSAVNTGRFWTVECGSPGPARVWFPCFDPGLGPEIGPPAGASAEPDLDLVFRALGDGTRWAMLGLLAERPMAPSELADALGIARSTVSHHLFLLREAGLVTAAGEGRAPLTLSRDVFARLSARTLDRFFAADGGSA